MSDNTSTELRAPNPTLACFPRDNEDGDLTTIPVTGLGDPGAPVAHRDRGGLPPGHPCRDVGWSPTPRLTVEQAAYIAVPCRECFPDEPIRDGTGNLYSWWGVCLTCGAEPHAPDPGDADFGRHRGGCPVTEQ